MDLDVYYVFRLTGAKKLEIPFVETRKLNSEFSKVKKTRKNETEYMLYEYYGVDPNVETKNRGKVCIVKDLIKEEY